MRGYLSGLKITYKRFVCYNNYMKAVLRGESVWRRVQKVLVLFLAFLLLVQPLSASALTRSELNFFGQNNILYYDPDSQKDCYSGSLSGDTNFAKIVSYFSGNNQYGISLSAEAIAGILANFKYESGMSAFRNQGSGDNMSDNNGYGIAQFTGRREIVELLRTDSRTSSYFNTYYDAKYGGPTDESGIPEGVPDEVNNAWLEVQLDHIVSSELQTTKVGGYRNLGGTMGLDYIPNNATILEAMQQAKTASDAARIWVWIYERSQNKSRDAGMRSPAAEEMLADVKSMMGSSGGGSSSGTSSSGVSGENVTIIGDSITVGASEELQAALPGVDINAEVGRQFDVGLQILDEKIANGTLRDTVVYALGTNSSGLTREKVQAVVDKVGKDRQVIFVTNYVDTSKRSGLDYTSNNNVFKAIQNENSNVKIADWASIANGNLISDDGLGVHPNSEGQQKFADLISATVSNVDNGLSVCATAVNGGMTNEQAQMLADYYKSDAVPDDSSWPAQTKWNCVSLSAFFIRNFTTLGSTARTRGNGRDVAYNLGVDYGLQTGTEPRPYAIFSVTEGGRFCGATKCGHTGVVVAVNGDDVTIVEAAYGHVGYTKVVHQDISYFTNAEHSDAVFVYTDTVLDMEKINNFINGAGI